MVQIIIDHDKCDGEDECGDCVDLCTMEVLKWVNGKAQIVLGRDWDYSTTTSKYVYMFLDEYGDINFYGVSNKRQYVNKLINEGKITYDENMR